MSETTNELVTQIRASLGGSQKGRTTNEIVAEIRDAIANGISGGGISEEDVRDIIAEVVDGAPEAFDTLKEVADWIEQNGSSSGADNVLIVPLTHHPEVMGTVEDTDDYKGIWNSSETYNTGDIVKHVVNNGYGNLIERYKGDWNSAVSYSIGNVVYYQYTEDVTQNNNYVGIYSEENSYSPGDIVSYHGAYYQAYDDISASYNNDEDYSHREPDSLDGWNDYYPESGEVFKQSVVNDNLNHNPYTDDGTYWEEVDTEADVYGLQNHTYIGVWDNATTYNDGDVVKVYNSEFGIYYYYYSVYNDNTNHDVTDTGDWWQLWDPYNAVSYWKCLADNITSEASWNGDWIRSKVTNVVLPAYYTASSATYGDIKTAFDSDKVVIAKGSDGKSFILSSASTTSGTTTLTFSAKDEFIAGSTSDLTNVLKLDCDTVNNVFVIPLTYHEALSVEEMDEFKGVYNSQTTYNMGDIVQKPYVNNTDIDMIGRYKGAWDSTVSYNEGDIVSFTAYDTTMYASSNYDDNLGNDPAADFANGTYDNWYFYESNSQSVFEYFEHYKGAWDDTASYEYGDVVSKLNTELNVTLYYSAHAYIPAGEDAPDSENGEYAWDKIGPIISYIYYKCIDNNVVDIDPSTDYYINYWSELDDEGTPAHYSSTVTYNNLKDAIKKNKVIVAALVDSDIFIGDNTQAHYYYLDFADYRDIGEGSGAFGTKLNFKSLDQHGQTLYTVLYDSHDNDPIKFDYNVDVDNLELISNWLNLNDVYEFDPYTYYPKGEIVRYNGALYQADTDNDSNDFYSGNWSPYHYQSQSSTFIVELAYNEGTEEDVTAKDEYKGEWDPTGNTYAYDDGDIVHYTEDVTRKSNYYGEYDSSITSYDNVGYNDPIVYVPEDDAYYYIEWDGEGSWLGNEYTPKSGYFYVEAVEEDDGDGYSHFEYNLGEQYIPEVGKDYYSTEVTSEDIYDAVVQGSIVIATYNIDGYNSKQLYTLTKGSTDDVIQFVGLDQDTHKIIILEGYQWEENPYLNLKVYKNNNPFDYIKDYVLNGNKTEGIIEGNVQSNSASGQYSHAEGTYTEASGEYSHAEGNHTTASESSSHAEGEQTTASGSISHAEGHTTTASGFASHSEGASTIASGTSSHAEGSGTIAACRQQHVFGEYNIEDYPNGNYGYGNYIEIVGNGKLDEEHSGTVTKSNARTLDWQGNESLSGSLTLGKGTADEVTITATQLKALLALLN